MEDNDQILTIYLYPYPHVRININDIYNTMLPSVHQKVGMQRWREKEITILREQYGATVHLFIGTGHNPDKITFMPLTFTCDYNTNYIGLNGLFPLWVGVVLDLRHHTKPKLSGNSFSAYSYHLRVVPLHCVYFHR
jgi:hypothetical protein